MTRYLYGGGGDGDIIKVTGVPYINATALVYSARSGGTQITDLQDVGGLTIWQVTTDGVGQVLFYGPDNFIGVLWLDFGSGPRWALSPKAVDLAATQAITVQRAADAAAPAYTPRAHLPYNNSNPLGKNLALAMDPLVIPRFGSSAARDAAFPTPQNGDRCYRTDLHQDQLYGEDGLWTGLVGVSAWNQNAIVVSPASGTFGMGSGSSGIRWRDTGKVVNFYFWMNFAVDSTYGTGVWTLTLPFTLNSNAVRNQPFLGQTVSSAGRFLIEGQAETSTTVSLWAVTSTTSNALARIGASPVPGGGTWGSGNFIRMSGTAELA
jgi:hypothetical protein